MQKLMQEDEEGYRALLDEKKVRKFLEIEKLILKFFGNFERSIEQSEMISKSALENDEENFET